MVWDAFKAVIRGEAVSTIRAARIHDKEELDILQRRERECAEAHASSPTEEATYVVLLDTRRLLSLHVTGQTRLELQKTAHTFFVEGDKNGKLLAMLVADYHPIANIPVIRDGGDPGHRSPARYAGVCGLFLSPVFPHSNL